MLIMPFSFPFKLADCFIEGFFLSTIYLLRIEGHNKENNNNKPTLTDKNTYSRLSIWLLSMLFFTFEFVFDVEEYANTLLVWKESSICQNSFMFYTIMYFLVSWHLHKSQFTHFLLRTKWLKLYSEKATLKCRRIISLIQIFFSKIQITLSKTNMVFFSIVKMAGCFGNEILNRNKFFNHFWIET